MWWLHIIRQSYDVLFIPWVPLFVKQVCGRRAPSVVGGYHCAAAQNGGGVCHSHHGDENGADNGKEIGIFRAFIDDTAENRRHKQIYDGGVQPDAADPQPLCDIPLQQTGAEDSVKRVLSRCLLWVNWVRVLLCTGALIGESSESSSSIS